MLAALVHHLGQFRKVIAFDSLRLTTNPQAEGRAAAQHVSSFSVVIKRFSGEVDMLNVPAFMYLAISCFDCLKWEVSRSSSPAVASYNALREPKEPSL